MTSVTLPELGERAFHRYSEDQETVSTSLPGKWHGPHLVTRECLPGPITLQKIQLHFKVKKRKVKMQGKKIRRIICKIIKIQ